MLSLPQLGNMIAVAAALPDILQLLQKWRKQHGDIFTIRMGSKYMVVISSYKVHDYMHIIQQMQDPVQIVYGILHTRVLQNSV